jgi:glycosyltransferase involved in cell wall biosynthesis/SAM-dependent methyltransferase
MTDPHFTIVIPTRNRLATLKSALKTCLEQDYGNFSVLVASNNCDDGTDDYVASLHDSRIVLAPVDRTLRMAENWSRAMPLALSRGGFITFMGDDDGLLPGALAVAAEIVRREGCQVLSWRKVEYAWPNVVIAAYRNHFSMSLDGAIEVRPSSDFLAGAHEYAVGYDEGPGLYSSFVHADVLGALQPAGGDWFAACAPDIYASYVIASAVPEFHKCRFGLSINGASGASTGTSYIHRPTSDAAATFKGQNAIHPALVHAPSIYIAEADGLLVARERFPQQFAAFPFSWPALVEKLLGDIRSAPSRLHYDLIVAALDKVSASSGLARPEVPPYAGETPAEPIPPPHGFDVASRRFVTTVDARLVCDVQQAGSFANSLFPLAGVLRDGLTIVRPGSRPADPEASPQPEVEPAPVPPAPVEAAGSGEQRQGPAPPSAASGLVQRALRVARRHYHWRNNTGKIEEWFARESDLARWLDHEQLIENTIRAHEHERAKQAAARDEFDRFEQLAAQSARQLRVDWSDRYLCLDDRTQQTGFDRHYIYHPAWAARVLAAVRPQRHTDISSTLTFCSIVSAFIPVDFYDYRPAPLQLTGLNSLPADLLALPFEDGSVESLSCMHVLEHVGLGRYGDALDPDGDLKAIRELCRVLAPGGSLLVASPVGQPKVHFNAHRVYRHREFLTWFGDLELAEFALIPDGPAVNGLIYDAPEHLVDAQSYGCGCYWFKKPA